MALINSIDNLKDIGLFAYSAKKNGDIELNFKIDEPGDYQLIITSKEIDRMKGTSDMMIKADRLGYFDE